MASLSAIAPARSPAKPVPAGPGVPAFGSAGEMDVVAPVGTEPASTLQGSVAADMALVVAPSVGRFRPLVDSGLVAPGTAIAVVNGGGGRADEVRVPVAAEVRGLLALDGQTVQSGQALAWVRRLDV